MVSQSLVFGYTVRTSIGLVLALFLGGVGVIVARMALVFFGLISWGAWFSTLLAGASVGAGVSCLIAWMWLRHSSRAFSATLLVLAVSLHET